MARETAWYGRAGSVALWVIATIAAVFFLREASSLLIPIVLGVLVSYALEPVVAWLARHHVPRLAGTSVVLLSLLGLVAWGTYTLRDDATRAMEALPEAARRAREFVAAGSDTGPARQVRQATQELSGSGSGAGADARGGSESPRPEGTSGQAPTAGMTQLVQRGIGSIVSLAGNVMVIFFLVFFLLTSGGHFRQRFIEAAGPQPENRRTTAQIIDDINAQIQRFLLVRLVTATVVAAATWVVVQWMGVQQAAVWGILAGVFNSIPYFGPVIVSGGLFVVGMVQRGDPVFGVEVAAAALVITSLEGWLLTPLLMGRAERMHVVVVFLGVLLWTWIWGGWGTILAVPMLVVLKSVADHVDSMKPIGKIMGH
jgi:predicted PurR-regulated permease PerM